MWTIGAPDNVSFALRMCEALLYASIPCSMQYEIIEAFFICLKQSDHERWVHVVPLGVK